MAISVAEIKGKGIAAFYADTGPLAELFVRDPAFCDDLMVLASDGLPLWDGMTRILVRQARPDEEAKWRAARAKAIRHGDIESEDHAWIGFLVVLTDPDRRKRR
jgi:hypothetical protein